MRDRKSPTKKNAIENNLKLHSLNQLQAAAVVYACGRGHEDDCGEFLNFLMRTNKLDDTRRGWAIQIDMIIDNEKFEYNGI